MEPGPPVCKALLIQAYQCFSIRFSLTLISFVFARKLKSFYLSLLQVFFSFIKCLDFLIFMSFFVHLFFLNEYQVLPHYKYFLCFVCYYLMLTLIPFFLLSVLNPWYLVFCLADHIYLLNVSISESSLILNTIFSCHF